ncbi:unnamed protein product [Lactuca virosa]|uniref:KANL2-like probable zinc-finger domain-containing protein n=1 Tax=Lactuca virosa TaxID=75947 RepID=A0AAU9MDJ0_9ASTR|nr:unnamed protein product [Lactuca virosa]
MDPTSTPNHKNPSTSDASLKSAPEDEYLACSTYLSRQQILRRRSHHLKQLTKCYRDQYWGLMEELRVKHREYVWKFGRNPFQEEPNQDDKDNVIEEELKDAIDDGIVESGDGDGKSNGLICTSSGCTLKAMILTKFCRLHILSDPKQQLYKPCEYVSKSGQDANAICGKPALRSMVPSLCSGHFQLAQEHVIRALRKAGLGITSTTNIAPKLHVVVAEYVREIQERRRIASRVNRKKIVPKVETES